MSRSDLGRVAGRDEDGPREAASVVVVGAGPVGLMLAAELRLAGVRPLVLERLPQPGDQHKAGGLGGQILELLRYRGLLERFVAASPEATHPAPIFPFGNIHLDFTSLEVSPMWGLSLPQPRLEALLDERARELGAEVRRGHAVVGLRDGGDAVELDIEGPDGPYSLAGAFVVGCDGPRSAVRSLAGIGFPGTSYPEINRVGQFTLPPSVTRLEHGGLDVPGFGRIAAGFTRTATGVFACGWIGDRFMVNTIEDDGAEVDDGTPMTVDDLAASIRRVLGADLPMGDVQRLSRWTYQARQAERYRDGRVLLAGDAAHLFPSTGIGLNVGMQDAVNLAWKLAAEVDGWAPPGLLDTYHAERHAAGARSMLQTQAQVALRRGLDPASDALRALFVELVQDEAPLLRMGRLLAGTDITYPVTGEVPHPLAGTFAPDAAIRVDGEATSLGALLVDARPLLVDLAGRPDLTDAAARWSPRVRVVRAEAAERPFDAVLLRPDAYIAWAARGDEPTETAVAGLQEALSARFGDPLVTPR